jgi:predicted nucleotide-binding protein
MSQPKKQKALMHLNLLLVDLEAIKEWRIQGYSSAEKDAWFKNGLLAMERLFGSISSEYRAFDGLENRGHPDRLKQAEFLLKARLREIDLYWPDDEIAVAAPLKGEQPIPSTAKPPAPPDPAKARRVWVVHGRDQRLRTGLFEFLRSIGLEPIEFGQARLLTKKPMPYVGEILEVAFQHAQAVVVLLTPDDQARLRQDLVKDSDAPFEKELNGQARPNVLFEAGMALVSHREQTVLVQFGKMRPFSDVAGRHLIEMDNSTPKRQELAQRLSNAGCSVNTSGTDWHTTGDLVPPK